MRGVFGKEHASHLYLKSSSNPKHPDEFYICYYTVDMCELENTSIEDQLDVHQNYSEPLPCYLETPVNMFGSHPGPLRLCYNIRDEDTRLTLESSFKKRHQPPVSLSAWMSGREMCFIKCARRRHRNGYIAVKPAKHDQGLDERQEGNNNMQIPDTEGSEEPGHPTERAPSRESAVRAATATNVQSAEPRETEQDDITEGMVVPQQEIPPTEEPEQPLKHIPTAISKAKSYDFSLCCVRSKKEDNGRTTFMLFQIVQTANTQQKSMASATSWIEEAGIAERENLLDDDDEVPSELSDWAYEEEEEVA